jgi:transcriptional regulator with XRE-family HTH domain
VLDESTAAGRLGAAIRRARLAVGLSVAHAAANAGVRRSRWYDWEQGRCVAPTLLLGTICEVLGCAVEDLLPEGN